MVAKISSGSSFYGALAYNQQKVDDGQARVLCTNLIIEPADGHFNVADCVADFQRWMPAQVRTREPMLHISLNPHPDDRLTDAQLSEIGREYMERMGYDNQPYIIFKHEDIDREHLHIVASVVDRQGRKIKDGNNFRRSREACDELERKYDLRPAVGQKRGELWQLLPIDAATGNVKRQIAAVVKPLCSMYRFQTFGEYRALLSLYNIGVEEVRGTVGDIPYRGVVYTALDGQGNKVGTPIKSSLISKSVGYDELERKMQRSGDHIGKPDTIGSTHQKVATALQSCRTASEFRAALRQTDVDLVLRYTETGRIYGATYIDHRSRCVMNGSVLGKSFAANALNELFAGQEPLIRTPASAIITFGQSAVAGPKKQTPEPFDPGVNKSVYADDSVVGGLLSVVEFENHNPQDERQMAMQRKKKKRKQRQ